MPASPDGLRHEAQSSADLPAVGDWVAVAEDQGGEAQIHQVLPRLTRFSRKAAGARTDEQVIAANVDTVWIVTAFGPNLNRNRIDRYLALVWESGAVPLGDPQQVRSCGCPSANGGRAGIDADRRSGPPGERHGRIGTGGAGQRAGPGKYHRPARILGCGQVDLLNRLAGSEVMRTGEIRAGDGKGRHKTTHRQLVLLPG